MSANSSFLLLDPHFLTNDSLCFFTSPAVFIIGTFSVTYILLLLPLCTFILCFGFLHLQQQSPTSAISHCDSFTYHLAGIELIGIVGSLYILSGICMKSQDVFDVGLYIFSYPWYGQIFFHTLTCVERYLAIVHPVTYLSLKNEKWIRIRNITSGCVWLICCVGVIVVAVAKCPFLDIVLLTASTITVSFCSLTALLVLIHPGPGERGAGRKRVDQSKRRAFYTIVVILGLMLIRLTYGLIWAGLDLIEHLNPCMMTTYDVWINFPVNLLLPLMFLQKTRKLLYRKN